MTDMFSMINRLEHLMNVYIKYKKRDETYPEFVKEFDEFREFFFPKQEYISNELIETLKAFWEEVDEGVFKPFQLHFLQMTLLHRAMSIMYSIAYDYMEDHNEIEPCKYDNFSGE